MEYRIQRMGSPNVVSIAAFISDRNLAQTIMKSDYIRSETVRRCYGITSYPFKSLEWKNRYYDFFRNRVITEMEDGQ